MTPNFNGIAIGDFIGNNGGASGGAGGFTVDQSNGYALGQNAPATAGTPMDSSCSANGGGSVVIASMIAVFKVPALPASDSVIFESMNS